MSDFAPTPPPSAPTPERHDWVDRVVAGKYALREVLGEGGMGTVFRANQLGVGRDVAVKILRPSMAANDPHVSELFFREARAAARLSHPHIVTVHDFGRTDDGLLYIAMELLEGRSLTALAASGELTLVEQLRISVQICRALSEAHAEGVVHRDVKPDNVLIVARRWDPHFVKMLDFGLVKVVGSSYETGQTGMRFGTPLYMSPEQILDRPLDHRADIYALGVLLFELFAGRPPFTGRTPLRVCMQHVEDPVPRMCDHMSRLALPAELDDLVHRMLAKDPEDRPQDIEEVRLSLRTILEWERSISPTTQTRRPTAEATSAGDDEHDHLRQSQPVAMRPSLRATDVLPDPSSPIDHARMGEHSPRPRLPTHDDPQSTMTQLIPELASRRPSLPKRAARPIPATSSSAASALARRGSHQAPAPAYTVATPSAPEPQAATAQKKPLRPRRPRTLRLDEKPAVALQPGRPAAGRRAHPRRAASRAKAFTWTDRAEYVARAILAALAGAAAGWGAYWMLIRVL